MTSTLTVDHIIAIYPASNSVTREQAEIYLPYLVEACREHDITDKNRVAGLLGQLGEESGELVYFEELWGPSEAQSGYEGRADLGNTEPGDGYHFRGSGPIQITGRYNTTWVCDALGLPLDPDLLRQPKDGFRAAAYFWTNMGNDYYDTSNNGATNLNRFADAGDIEAMTYGVNGGFTNYENRVWYYNTAMEVLPDDLDLNALEGAAEPVAGYDTLVVEEDAEGWSRDQSTGALLRYDNRPNAALYTNSERWFYAPDIEDGPSPWGGDEYSQIRVVRDPQSYLIDAQTGAYLRSDQHADAVFKTSDSNWIYYPAEVEQVPLKKGIRHPGSGWYVEQHPTHHDWREDVKALVDRVESEFDDIYINTYYDHPPGYGLDAVSLDVWDSDGRGCTLDWDLHDLVWERLFNDPAEPQIRWALTKGYMWTPGAGWERWYDYDEASDAQHNRHIHITYW